jgi:hypothetical protein
MENKAEKPDMYRFFILRFEKALGIAQCTVGRGLWALDSGEVRLKTVPQVTDH